MGLLESQWLGPLWEVLVSWGRGGRLRDSRPLLCRAQAGSTSLRGVVREAEMLGPNKVSKDVLGVGVTSLLSLMLQGRGWERLAPVSLRVIWEWDGSLQGVPTL